MVAWHHDPEYHREEYRRIWRSRLSTHIREILSDAEDRGDFRTAYLARLELKRRHDFASRWLGGGGLDEA